MFNFTKKLINKSLNLAGFEIHRRKANLQLPRASMHECLRQARQNGLLPKTIIDVGAATGTPALYEVFLMSNTF